MSIRYHVCSLTRMLAALGISSLRDVRCGLTEVTLFRRTRNNTHRAGLLVAAVLISFSTTNSVRAQDNAGFYEIETKYIFGFTEGSGARRDHARMR